MSSVSIFSLTSSVPGNSDSTHESSVLFNFSWQIGHFLCVAFHCSMHALQKTCVHGSIKSGLRSKQIQHSVASRFSSHRACSSIGLNSVTFVSNLDSCRCWRQIGKLKWFIWLQENFVDPKVHAFFSVTWLCIFLPYRVVLHTTTSPPSAFEMCWTPSGIVSNWLICSFQFYLIVDRIWRMQCEQWPSTGMFDRCPFSQRISLFCHLNPSTCVTYPKWDENEKLGLTKYCQRQQQ